tara:strand:- start:441 stop:614 length:174 start_codon:yes stop_codon:yes gene_type:complete
MNKGILLIQLVSNETLIEPNLLMDNKEFVLQAKKLINQKLNFDVIKSKLVKWVNNNY